MKVIAQSTASTKMPYVHLAYLAANNSTKVSRGVISSAGVILLIAAVLLAKSMKKVGASAYTFMPSLSRKYRLAIAVPALLIGLTVLCCGLVIKANQYSPSRYLIQMGDTFQKYADKNNGLLPDAENWCDSLIIDGHLDPRSFDFDGGDVLYGESAFAFNKHIAGKKLSDIPPDTVLLFETDSGHDTGSREVTISSRDFFDASYENSYFASYHINVKISEKRWNQSGNVEILTNRYNDDKGCDVLFADGHAEFVPARKIKSLKW